MIAWTSVNTAVLWQGVTLHHDAICRAAASRRFTLYNPALYRSAAYGWTFAAVWLLPGRWGLPDLSKTLEKRNTIMMRSHYCGQLNESLDGQEITLCGWVHRRRDHGG